MDFKQQLSLEDDRALLRPLSLDNLADLQAIAAQPDLVKYSPSLINTEEHLRNYIWTALKRRLAGGVYAFSIYDKKTREYAGSTRFANLSVADERVEIGWTWIGRQFHGTGLNMHCKFLLLRCAFEQFNWWRVEFRTDARNLASRKAILKIGAKEEGCMLGHMLMPDGYRRDTIVYGILQKDWPHLKSTIFKGFK